MTNNKRTELIINVPSNTTNDQIVNNTLASIYGSKCNESTHNELYSKGNMLTYLKRKGLLNYEYDTAIPLYFSKLMRRENMSCNWIVWSYEHDRLSGEPINLLELYISTL